LGQNIHRATAVNSQGFYENYDCGYYPKTASDFALALTESIVFSAEVRLSESDGTADEIYLGNISAMFYSQEWKRVTDDILRYTLLSNGTYSVKAGRGANGVKTITIPSTYSGKSVTKVEDSGFSFLTCLEKVVFPTSLTVIDDYAFQNCISLKTADLSKLTALKTLGKCSFKNCQGITSVTVLSNVTDFRNYAFEKCYSLTSISLYTTVIPEGTFYDCKALKSYTVPSSVTFIGGGAFRECTSLQSLTIPASVTSIYGNCCWGCTALTNVTFKNSYIGEYMFYGCTSLTSITIPDSVTRIGICAFLNSGLKTVNMTDYSGWRLERPWVATFTGNGPADVTEYYKSNFQFGTVYYDGNPNDYSLNFSALSSSNAAKYLTTTMKSGALKYKTTGTTYSDYTYNGSKVYYEAKFYETDWVR